MPVAKRYPDGGGLSAEQRSHRERVRFMAADMFQSGMAPPVVARQLRVSRKSAYAWYALWWEGGTGALRSRGSHVSLRGAQVVATGLREVWPRSARR